MVPYLRRHLIEPAYYAWNASPRLRYWKELEATQYLSPDELLYRQWLRLQGLLAVAWSHNAFYRKRFESAGMSPGDVHSPRDLACLPVLTKQQIRENLPDLITAGYRREDLMRFRTGGSTGTSLELYLTEECSELRNACARRHDCWTGWRPGEPIGAVWGNPKLPRGIKARLRHWLLSPSIYLDTMNVTDASVERFARDWKRARPTLLFGHAHSLYLLACCVGRLGIDDIRPRGILSTSMMLMPHERRTIEEAFGVSVTDRYGCEEVSLIGSECELHRGMHLNVEHLLIEFVREDGRPAAPGETGRIVVTDLMNAAMPFIRYQVEDMGVPSDRTCPCGRGLPLMERVVGRTADFLVRSDGSRVAGVSLIENTLTGIPGIDQMQIIQEAVDHLVIRIVRGPACTASTGDAIREYFLGLFGRDSRVEVVTVERIEPEPSGKYRFSICRVPGEAQVPGAGGHA